MILTKTSVPSSTQTVNSTPVSDSQQEPIPCIMCEGTGACYNILAPTGEEEQACTSCSGTGEVLPLVNPPLRDLAAAALQAHLEKKALEEQHAERLRREQHVEQLSCLLKSVLSCSAPILWCGIQAEGTHPDYRYPIAEIDGLHFTSDYGDEALKLILFQQRVFPKTNTTVITYQYSWQRVHSLVELGRLISHKDIFGKLVGSTLYPVAPPEQEGQPS